MVLTAVRFPPKESLSIRTGLQFHSAYFTINEDNSVNAYSRDYLHHLHQDIQMYQTQNGDAIHYGQITNMETIRYQETCRIVKKDGCDTVNVYEVENTQSLAIIDWPLFIESGIPPVILWRLNK